MKYKIGARVISSAGTQEGTILAYSLQEHHDVMYKVKWDGVLIGYTCWIYEELISEIITK